MEPDLTGLEGKTYAEALANLYEGQLVEVYFGESSGNNYYSDYDVENKVYSTGYIVGAIGSLLLMDIEIFAKGKQVVKRLSLNGFSITGVMPVIDDGVHITALFKESKR